MSRAAAQTTVEGLMTQISQRLEESLGGRFRVLSSEDPAADDLPGIVEGADFVVYDAATGKLVLVEVKGSRPSDDLPLATIPFLQRMKERANPHDVVLVSASHVPPLVQEHLASSEIRVVESSPGRDVVPELAAAIHHAVS